jgi:CDP-glucose 4,6-dehydratase
MENMGKVDFLEFYNSKRVFITGVTGFKGGWMAKWLEMLGADILGYALKSPYENNLSNSISNKQPSNFIIGDIRDYEKLSTTLQEFKPDLVFHLAAQALVRESYTTPVDTYSTNVMGTMNVLQAVSQLENKCTLVNVTTDKVYKNTEDGYPFRETDPLGGFSPYSSSKACCEILTDSFRNSFMNISNVENHGKGVVTVRAGNVIGGGDWSIDRLVPDIIRSFVAKKEVTIRSPNSVRPWQHVLEPLAGYLKIGYKNYSNPSDFSGGWNFGPYNNDVLTVGEVVEIAQERWGLDKRSYQKNNKELHESNFLLLDISKAIRELHWKPLLPPTEAIAQTVDWYKNFYENQYNKSNINSFTETQISNFSSLL